MTRKDEASARAQRAPAASAPARHARSDSSGREQESNTLRCECGSLMARYVEGGIELKCRRCKRTQVIKLSDISGSID
jgi:hypothetical protein